MASSTAIPLNLPTYCLVTGASQGIGRAISVELSKALGPDSVMLLVARNATELENTAALCKSPNVTVKIKSTDLATATTEQMADLIKDSVGQRDITDFANVAIFHNVGSLGDLSVATDRMESVQDFREYFDLNLFNVVALNTQFMKFFADIEERMVIVNITSLCAVKPMGGMAYYCAGKAAREMYFKVLAEEKKSIRVLNYSPGPVETAMIDHVISEAVNDNLKEVFNSFISQGTLLKPEVTARKCIRVLESGNFGPGDHVDYFDE